MTSLAQVLGLHILRTTHTKSQTVKQSGSFSVPAAQFCRFQAVPAVHAYLNNFSAICYPQGPSALLEKIRGFSMLCYGS